MLAVSFPASAMGTNCYVLAPGRGEECVVVDPGIGVESTLAEVLREHRLRPAAVLLTHGHVDHVWSVAPVCGGTLAAHIHEEDAHRLGDPLAGVSGPLLAMLEAQFGGRATWREPERVETFAGGATLELAGLTLEASHAPGHTEGSAVFAVQGLPEGLRSSAKGRQRPGADRLDQLTQTVLTGDVLFAGSIGRTDLPGGDAAAMQRSLREVILPLPDTSLVLPGHGPATTMAHERTTNPYLLEVQR